VISPLLYLNQEANDCRVEISFQMVDSPNDNILSFVNNITTNDGGTHVNGFKTAFLNVVNEIAKAK
jgi:DNA gyrase subunit B